MVAAIDVNDVQRMDFVKMMLESPCRLSLIHISRRDERELEEELVPVSPVSDMPDAQETLLESAPVAQSSEMESELESDTMPDIKELEEGLPCLLYTSRCV